MTTRQISAEDQAAITHMFSKYCRGIDDPDQTLLESTFWEDCVLGSPMLGGDFVGYTGLKDFLDVCYNDDRFSDYRRGQHWIGTVTYDPIDEDTVKVASYFLYFNKQGEAPRLLSYGTYADVVTRKNGEWRFSRRDITVVADVNR